MPEVVESKALLPARRVAEAHARRRKFERRIGPPSRVGNTSPPGSARSLNCSSSIAATDAGTETLRLPAVVFTGPTDSRPLTSVICSTTDT
jgi:hypothetical protein